MHKLLTILLLFLLVGINASAQKKKVYGVVSDADTKAAIPFVRVIFKDSKIGTQTDFEGKFNIETYYATDSLVFEVIGYKRKALKVTKELIQEINIELSSVATEMEEAVVTSNKKVEKDEPAISLWKKVQKNKKINNREKLEAYQYEVYNKVELDLNNITEDFKQRKVFKHFDFIFDNIDSTDEKPYLPLFMSESVSDYYYRKFPKSEKEYIKATKISGVENESVSQFLGEMYQKVNVYDNQIIVFGKAFISPIAVGARAYYHFYLTDSAYIDSNYCYKLNFIARRKMEPTFEGELWINDTTYAIKQVKAKISDDANINFINTLTVEQKFEQVEDEVWMLVNDNLFVDFYISNKAMGVYGRKSTSYKDFLINNPKEDTFYSGIQNIYIADDVNGKTETYWDSVRHDSLTANQKVIYNMMDTLENVPAVRTYIDVISTLVSGYKVIGPIEIGPYSSIYSFNQVEGHRFRLGGRTSNAFSTRIEFSGYGAYGTRDNAFKYGGGFRYMVSKKPRQVLGMYYKNDVELLGQTSDAYKDDSFVASFFRRRPNNRLSYVEEIKAYYDHEWMPGFNTQLLLRRRGIGPSAYLPFQVYNENQSLINVPEIVSSEATIYTRFAYDEKFLDGEFERVSLGTKYPVLAAQYTFGFKGVLGSDYEYQKLKVSVRDWFYVGVLGWMRYNIEAGKVWGTLPFPLLELHQGNETYYYNDYSFNMMNYFEFVSDEFVSGWFTHHFDGLFFNKIPLFRKLKWREVITGKAVYGRLTNLAHKDQLNFLPNMHTLEAKPYVEAAVGIENIFKILRVDAIWRLTYLNNQDIAKFGIRAKFDIQF